MACGYSGNTGIFANAICEDALIGLNMINRDCNIGENKRTKIGFTQMLMHPLNMVDIEVIPIEDMLKERTVRIYYLQRAIQSQINDTCSVACTGDFDDFCETTFACTTDKCYEWQVSRDDFQRVCAGTEKEFAQRLLMSKFDAFAREINEANLATMNANFGENARTGNNLTVAINVLTVANNDPVAVGLLTVDQDYREFNEYCGMPLIVGQGNWARYNKVLDSSCCNDGGIDYADLVNKTGFGFFLDTQAIAAWGANQIGVFAPGTHQFVQYNRTNSETIFEVSPLSAYTRMIDPVTGINYDFTVIFDDCAREWYFKLETCFDLFVPPTDQYNASDPQEGTTGSLRYTANTV